MPTVVHPNTDNGSPIYLIYQRDTMAHQYWSTPVLEMRQVQSRL